MNIEYIDGKLELLYEIKELWLELTYHHKNKSKYFKNHFENLIFENRIEKFKHEDIKDIKVDLVKDSDINEIIGYCISTVDINKIGEVDSLYIKDEYRKYKIGNTLMERALSWLNSLNVDKKKIVVAEGNENVLDFYKKYGFKVRSYTLYEVEDK